MKKKILALALIVVLAISFAACSSSSAKKEIEINGKTVTLNLAENPTTGFTWVYQISDESIISLSKDDFKADDVGTAGAGGTRILLFEGKSEGSATITLEYKREWEEEEPTETKTITVTVDANGNISSAK